MQTLVVYFILPTCIAIYVTCITVHRKKRSILAVIDDGASIVIGRCLMHVLLTSRPGSPSFPCQRTTVATLVFLRFKNRLLF